MKDTAARMLPGIAYTFNNNGRIYIESLQARRNLFLIYKEILNNIAKHSEAKKVIIDIDDGASAFKLNIADDGKGFDKENITLGNGLKNIQKRLKESNGKIGIISQPGSGTEISILIEINLE